jgi:hypothetical protein
VPLVWREEYAVQRGAIPSKRTKAAGNVWAGMTEGNGVPLQTLDLRRPCIRAIGAALISCLLSAIVLFFSFPYLMLSLPAELYLRSLQPCYCYFRNSTSLQPTYKNPAGPASKGDVTADQLPDGVCHISIFQADTEYYPSKPFYIVGSRNVPCHRDELTKALKVWLALSAAILLSGITISIIKRRSPSGLKAELDDGNHKL